MKDPVAAWAAAALKHSATAKALRQKLDKKPSPLAARFGLDPLERRILELAHAVERAFDVARLARAAGGGLTVELVRATLGDDVDAALSPRRALRRHALVAVGAGGQPAAGDLVRPAPGVSARLAGAADPEALWLGITRVAPNGRGDVAARVAMLLRDVDAGAATLVTLDGCPRREAYELAAGLARQRGHCVVVVDGELLATAADPALLLACVRREADCEGDALIVCAATALGERWRALLAPPTGPGPAPLLLLADAERTRDPVAAAPFTVRRLSLHPQVATPAILADTPRKEEPPADDGLEQVRQLAIRDAERALGIYRAPPPPPRASTAQVAAPPVAAPPVAAPPVAAPPVAAPPVAAPAATAAPPSTPAAPPRKMSAKAMEHFAARLGVDPAAAAAAAAAPPAAGVAPAAPVAAPPSAPAATPPSAPVATPPSTVAVAPPLAALADLADGTPLPVAASASPDELARVASTSPSAAQRIELIGRIRLHKTAAVVAALRANAVNPHPGVRAAAEAAMASLFGPNWNTTRPVPKPVQRPPSDDKDRGPPGGY